MIGGTERGTLKVKLASPLPTDPVQNAGVTLIYSHPDSTSTCNAQCHHFINVALNLDCLDSRGVPSRNVDTLVSLVENLVALLCSEYT